MTKSYSFHCSENIWLCWTRTIPESQRIDERLKRLILADLLGDASILEETPTSEEPGIDVPVDDVLASTSPTGSQETVGEGGGHA